MRALLYPLGGCQRLHLLILGEHDAQALVMRVSFFWGSFRGSTGGASHISVIVVKFLTVPLNRQIKVLYHGIESISR